MPLIYFFFEEDFLIFIYHEEGSRDRDGERKRELSLKKKDLI
jgi:hypothetical protein